MKITVTTEIETVYTLNKEQATRIIQYAKANNVDLEEAVDNLFLSLNLQNACSTISSNYQCENVELDNEEKTLFKKHKGA